MTITGLRSSNDAMPELGGPPERGPSFFRCGPYLGAGNWASLPPPGGRHETSPPKVPSTHGRRHRRTGIFASRFGGGLSGATGARHRGLWRRRRGRHHRAVDRAMAEREARAILRGREPHRRRRQYRHRGGGDGRPRRLHAAARHRAECGQRLALHQPQVQLHPRYCPRRRHHPGADVHHGASVGAGENRPRTDRPRQGQSGQGQHGVRRQRQRIWQANCSR